MIRKKENSGVGIYVHIPFCKKKCNYCDFLSFNMGKDIQEKYIKSLIGEINIYKNIIPKDKVIDTIYIGGGTPSYIDEDKIKDVIYVIKDNFKVNNKAEITIEINPGTVDKKKLECYKKIGINRVSVGLQSACNRELEILGRIHTCEEFLETFYMIRECGFDNVNIDVMSAIPCQDISSYLETLNKVIELRPEHISSYSLIIEENTPFYDLREQLELVEQDNERKMYEMTKKVLMENGYNRYEISNYSIEGKQSKHNMGYWELKEYYGFGIGAASYDGNKRYKNISNINDYIYLLGDVCDKDLEKDMFNIVKKITCDIEVCTNKTKMEEFMFLGMRKSIGVSIEEFSILFDGVDIENIYGEVIDKYKKLGFIAQENGRIYFTDKGVDVSNMILSEFIL